MTTKANGRRLNGESALDWVIERQVVKTGKASGIENDANDYANETMKIVRALPKPEIGLT